MARQTQAQRAAAEAARRRRAAARKLLRETAQRLNGELPPTGLIRHAAPYPERRSMRLRRWNFQIQWRREGERDWHWTSSFGTNLQPLRDEDVVRGWRIFGREAAQGSDGDIDAAYEAIVYLYGEGYRR